MKKRVEKSSKEKVDKVDSVTDEEPPKTAVNEGKCFVVSLTLDDYQCSGNLELDFTELCKLMAVKEIPSVKIKRSASTNGGVMGWKVDEVLLQVLSRLLPSLSNLQCLHMWRMGLTDHTFNSMRNTVSLCSNLRKVVLEGNPLPEQSYHLLIGEDSMLTDLSLRNNHIGEEGARLIGSALSTVHSANKNLLSLNLAFNSFGDAGAIHIAQGLRLNRSLLCLSLSYNQIGDNGAAHLAEVLGPFALSHEEIVERRKLLIKGEESTMVQPSLVSLADSHERPVSVRSSSSLDRLSKSTKNSTKKKENPKKRGKTSGRSGSKERGAKDNKVPRSQAGKSAGKDNNLVVSEQEVVETVNPLLDPGIVHTGGKVINPGNTCLTSLNLSGNKLTEQSLKAFLSSLEGQGEGGLLRLSLNRNQFPSDCDTYLKIQEMMSLRDPLKKNCSGRVEDEHSEPKTTSEA
ncbi:Leucine-rich repeat-containing protein 71 [Labeo rohita]|uniref:Leucine-rich repeat-containing protein 71 n=1 Tax=Labeo rohita TaxID=84645 RepID=A0ABQ8LQW1_LABRO|nr:Leucine-rich repeat-containing protein 71 [Labeo rohita]